LKAGLVGYDTLSPEDDLEGALGGADSGTGCRDELEERELLNDTVGVYSGYGRAVIYPFSQNYEIKNIIKRTRLGSFKTRSPIERRRSRSVWLLVVTVRPYRAGIVSCVTKG
jgi:hypothetical protein